MSHKIVRFTDSNGDWQTAVHEDTLPYMEAEVTITAVRSANKAEELIIKAVETVEKWSKANGRN